MVGNGFNEGHEEQLRGHIVDITEPSPLDFAEDTNIPVTSVVLSLGVLARASRLAYTLHSEVPHATWENSQEALLELMQHVREAGNEEYGTSDVTERSYTPIFVGVYDILHAQSNVGSHAIFIEQMDAFLDKQRKFVEKPSATLHEDISNILRPYTLFLRVTSENYFIDQFGPAYLESEVLIPDTLVDHDLLREFTDQEYWRHSTNELGADRTRATSSRLIGRMGVMSMHRMLTDSTEAEDAQVSTVR